MTAITRGGGHAAAVDVETPGGPPPSPVSSAAPTDTLRFYLGTHEASWLARLDVPLFVSRRRLQKRRSLPRAIGRWALDSGGFTELKMHRGWTIDAATYASEVERYRDEIGGLDWVAPQDWMCEPVMLARTGLTVAEHQSRTVHNFVELRARLGPLVIPVLQGYTLSDYLRCVDLYSNHEIDLTREPLVGLGSVCRRQATAEIGQIVATFAGDLALHGFGCKTAALARYGVLLASADSLAWSYAGRRRGTCQHLKSRCANHAHYALDWRSRLTTARSSGQLAMKVEP